MNDVRGINRIYLISKWASCLSINIFLIRIARLVLHSYFIVAWRQAIKAHYANNKNWLCVPSRRKPRLLPATSIIFQFYPVLQRINAQFCVCIGCHATAFQFMRKYFLLWVCFLLFLTKANNALLHSNFGVKQRPYREHWFVSYFSCSRWES